ncbi:MAG: hypothetical protein K8L91_28830 [Anaerolineae bacterium]|nr:hypothetical protein [Anaerolineae bacterium]
MPRLLKITALLMGLVLLVMSLGGTMLRPNDPNEHVPVVYNEMAITDRQLYLQIWPGVTKPLHFLPPGYNMTQFLGINPHSGAIYFLRQGADYTRSDLVQISGIPPHAQTVAQDISPDSLIWPRSQLTNARSFEWVMFASFKPDGNWEYWITHLVSGQRYNLSAWIAPHQVYYQGGGLVISTDRLLLLPTYDSAQNRVNILRVDLQDGTWTNLTASYTLSPLLTAWTHMDDWLIIGNGPRLYRLSFDGAIFEPLVEEDTGSSESLLSLDKDSGIAVIEHNSDRLGIEVSTRRIIWQYSELDLGYGRSNNAQGWLLAWHNRVPVRLHIPTGEIQSLPSSLDPFQDFPILQTSDTLIYTHKDPTSMEISWGRTNWDTGVTHLIRHRMNDFQLFDVSPDGRWLWLKGPDGLYRMRVADGHLDHLMDGGPYFSVGWTRPFTRTWQPTPLLLIALALITFSILPRPLLQLLHRNPSSYRGH